MTECNPPFELMLSKRLFSDRVVRSVLRRLGRRIPIRTADHGDRLRLDVDVSRCSGDDCLKLLKRELTRGVLKDPGFPEGKAEMLDDYTLQLCKTHIKISLGSWVQRWPTVRTALRAVSDQTTVMLETTDPIDRLVVELWPLPDHGLVPTLTRFLAYLDQANHSELEVR